MRWFVIAITILSAMEVAARIYAFTFDAYPPPSPDVKVFDSVVLLAFALWGTYLLGKERDGT